MTRARPLTSPQTSSMPTMSMPVTRDPDSDSLTIGVAVEVPEPWASYLQRSRADFGDPMATAIPAHITLVPPTPVAPQDVDDVVSHLAGVAVTWPGFEVGLEGTDTFRPVSPVVFVRVVQGGGNCDRLQRAVRTGPLRRDLTFPFHPHVTVAHQVDEAALDLAAKTLASFSASFRVDGFWLYEHGRDGVWRPRHRFTFGAPASQTRR